MAVSNGRHEKKPNLFNRLGFYLVAEWTGLEPATPGVTGRANTQTELMDQMLNQQSFICCV